MNQIYCRLPDSVVRPGRGPFFLNIFLVLFVFYYNAYSGEYAKNLMMNQNPKIKTPDTIVAVRCFSMGWFNRGPLG